jgi:hypothetical protein
MSDKKDDVFVNRYGHEVSVDGSDFVPPPKPEPGTPRQSVQPLKKPAKIRKVRNKKSAKKLMLILLVVLLGLVLIPVLGGELVRARYVSSRDGAHARLAEFATKTVVPQQKKQMKLSQLSASADRVEKIRDDACDGGFTDNLAMMYPRAKLAFDECIALKLRIATIAAHLRDMESQVRYLDALTPIITPVAKDTTEGFAIISAQHENWRTLNEALGKLSPAASQRTAHDQLLVHSKTIVDAWSKLNSANNSQDGKAFTEAEKKLSESYEVFRSSSATFTGIMYETQSKLSASYKAL